MNKTLPTDFKFSIGNETIDAEGSPPAQSCVLAGNTATCSNIPTSNSVGNLTIYSELTNTAGSKTSTTKTLSITGINMAKVSWNFTPNQGSTSPLFRSTDGTTINISNLKTNFDLTPTSDTKYTCKLEYRNLNDREAITPSWTNPNTSLLYTMNRFIGSLGLGWLRAGSYYLYLIQFFQDFG